MAAAPQAARFAYLPISTPSMAAGVLRSRTSITPTGTPRFTGAHPDLMTFV